MCVDDTVNVVSLQQQESQVLPGPPLPKPWCCRGTAGSRSVPQHLGSPDPTHRMGPSLPPRSSMASGFWFKTRLSGKAVLGPQEQAADGGRSEFLTMGEPVETWVGKQCGEGLPSSQLSASSIEKVGSAALATALQPSLLLGMYVLICPAYNWEDNSNCPFEELPMPLTAMPERAPANMPHQPKALG